MRRFYIYTNDYKNVLDIEADVLSLHKVQPDEEYEIDVFDEDSRLITTISSSNRSNH
jgi:hypothetical protein